MNHSINYYKKLSLLAIIFFVLLTILQVNWLIKAVATQQEASQLQLKQLIPDLAMEVNNLGHHYFHGEEPPLKALDFDLVENKVQAYLDSAGITEVTYFAIYQEEEKGFFKSNVGKHEEELKTSTVQSCMSCIVSFSISKGVDPLPGESDEAFAKRVASEAEFQYYSPVQQLEKDKKAIIWLSLYQPNRLASALWSMSVLFGGSLFLLLALLALFRYLLNQLSEHKKLAQIKEDFFNNVTHEFKTPLSSIRLASKVLRQNKAPEKHESYFDLIERESQSLENQIDKLLQLSFLDNKELELEFVNVDLHEIIMEIPHRLKPLLEEHQGKLFLDLQMKPSLIKGDYDHLFNSLCNLVENSLKYAKKTVNIWISTQTQKEDQIIVVRDNGPGIRSEYQAHIFDRFYRAKKQNQYKNKGFGIGLSYVKTIIEAHQGQIVFNANYTNGCEFIIKF